MCRLLSEYATARRLPLASKLQPSASGKISCDGGPAAAPALPCAWSWPLGAMRGRLATKASVRSANMRTVPAAQAQAMVLLEAASAKAARTCGRQRRRDERLRPRQLPPPGRHACRLLHWRPGGPARLQPWARCAPARLLTCRFTDLSTPRRLGFMSSSTPEVVTA
jgi:hypothetical protein